MCSTLSWAADEELTVLFLGDDGHHRPRQRFAACRTHGVLPVDGTAPAAGDWIELIKGYIKDGGLVLGLAIRIPASRPA